MHRGHVATIVGAILLGSAAEVFFVLSYKAPGCEGLNLAECLTATVAGGLLYGALALAGMWLAAWLGGWIGLRIRGYPYRLMTMFLLAVLLLPWGALVVWVNDVTLNLDPTWWVFWLAPLALFPLPALAARALTLFFRERKV